MRVMEYCMFFISCGKSSFMHYQYRDVKGKFQWWFHFSWHRRIHMSCFPAFAEQWACQGRNTYRTWCRSLGARVARIPTLIMLLCLVLTVSMIELGVEGDSNMKPSPFERRCARPNAKFVITYLILSIR